MFLVVVGNTAHTRCRMGSEKVMRDRLRERLLWFAIGVITGAIITTASALAMVEMMV